MHDNIVAGIEYAEIGMGMKPADNVILGIAAGAIFMELRPGIGRKGEVHRPMISRYGGDGGAHIEIDLRFELVGAAQEQAAHFPIEIAAAMHGDLFEGQLREEDNYFMLSRLQAVEDTLFFQAGGLSFRERLDTGQRRCAGLGN